jgi:hypothetical protein
MKSLGAVRKEEEGEKEEEEEDESELDTKALMFISSLCPISVEGVIRGLR